MIGWSRVTMPTSFWTRKPRKYLLISFNPPAIAVVTSAWSPTMTHHDIVQEFLRQKADALVRADGAFFERVLHPQFFYVNTRGVRLDRAGYRSLVATPVQ